MMTLQEAMTRTERATVQLTNQGGRGVLVYGGFFLTAAHCVEHYNSGSMALGDFCLELVLTAGGAELVASVAAVEPVADVAALCCPDGQSLPEFCGSYDRHVDSTEPVPLRVVAPDLRETLAVHVWTHEGRWVRGTATRYGVPWESPSPTLGFRFEEPIKGGTSGSPVIDDAGELVGLISFTCGGGLAQVRDGDGARDGQMPMPWLALPRWLCDRIARAQGEGWNSAPSESAIQ